MAYYKVAKRTTRLYVNLINSLGNALASYSDTSKKPLVLSLNEPLKIKVTIYLFLGTNPKGGRSEGEYKITLAAPGQARRTQGNFEADEGYPLLLSYVPDHDAYVFFNTRFHVNFGYNTNVQFRQELIFDAKVNGVSTMTKNNGETIVCSTSENIVKGFSKWFDVLCN